MGVSIGRYLEKPKKCCECRETAWFYVVVSETFPVSFDDFDERETEVPICERCLKEQLEEAGVL